MPADRSITSTSTVTNTSPVVVHVHWPRSSASARTLKLIIIFFHIGPAIQCAYLILPLSLSRRLAVPMYNVKKIAVELKVRWITSRTNYVMFSVLLSPLNSACLSMASINSCRRRLFFLTDFVALTRNSQPPGKSFAFDARFNTRRETM